ncbi:hypothetical protein UFOVP228_48 [uncultured Caudovirales phage]|uniref:Uncharacterized protein n=1 Tax=uncultured Caudovirales phage TaxID=2100421 RepID=A0A6J5T8F5_9CAUD|nr:hypothetical protein UFOVP47_54 [uncultured Caudovirales phage]CAB5219272.1 hypothetical protein UFOVP228_48 [uncultured Caudovirales phage]
MVMRADGRYLRFSWRYGTWQVKDKTGHFRNVSVPMARCYATAGFPIGVQT